MSAGQPAGDLAVVRLAADTGRLDVSAVLLQLHELASSGARAVVVDVAGVDELPPVVISALLRAHRECQSRGGHATIRNANSRTLDQMHATGLWRIFEVESPLKRLKQVPATE